MNFQAVGNRCAVHFPSLDLPMGEEEALEILEKRDYRRLHVDVVAIARERVGKARYRRGARPQEAPDVFDCSRFTQWLYGRLGIRLPRYSIQQFEVCHLLPSGEPMAGDLAFSEGAIPWYRRLPTLGIGHVGFVTNERTVIHAANGEKGVVEEPLVEWETWKGFRGVRRFIPSGMEFVTLECPPTVDIECSDDIRWKILKTLPRK